MNPHEEDEQSDDDYWIDAPRMAELAERFNRWCQHSLESQSRYEGSRQIVRFLVELISLSSIPVRLVRGKTDYEVPQADRTSLYLAPSVLAGVDKVMTAWIDSKSVMTSDSSQKSGLKSPHLRIISFEEFEPISS